MGHDGGIRPTNTYRHGRHQTSRTSSPRPDHFSTCRWRSVMRTAIDVRVSTERQTLAHTSAQQVERLTAHVHAQGEALRAEDMFRDDGYRGATRNRPG
jgi:hypothetical protein